MGGLLMAVNEGRKAHEHGLMALSYLLNEPWSFELLGLVRYELGQAYFWLNKHVTKGTCACGDGIEDLELYKQLLVDVNIAISTESLNPIPLVVAELKAYFALKKTTHNCICHTLDKHMMTHDV
jgi:hypothetical protein